MKRLGPTALLTLILATGASAQTVWYVDVSAPPGGDGSWQEPYQSIQVALDQSTTVSGDQIRVAPGVYNEQLDLLGKEVKIGATMGAAATVIDGGGLGSTLTIASGEGPKTLIQGFTITGGVGQPGFGVGAIGGGAFVYSSSVTFSHCVFEDNQAILGGGIFAYESNLTILDSTFADNHATIGPSGSIEDGDGGAIWAGQRSNVLIENSIFTGNIAGGVPLNTAARGGAIFLNESVLALDESVFTDNLATCNLNDGYALGGALCAVDLSVVDVGYTTFQGSTAFADHAHGGALYLEDGQMYLEFGYFDNNVAGDFLEVLHGEGGAIYVADGSESFVETTWFRWNQAQAKGGAIYGVGAYRDCEFISNQSRNGGAAYASWTAGVGAMSFDEVRFLDNKTSWGEFGQRDGGAVHGPAVIVDSLVLDNLAHGKGGGAFGAYLYSCTVDGNETVPNTFPAQILGGGVHDCWVWDSVISNNAATGNRFFGVQSYGGGASSSFLMRTELWGNVADYGAGAANSTLEQVTANANVANVEGGGAWFQFMPLVSNIVTNSIVWNNLPDEIFDAGGNPFVTYTDVKGGWPGIGNANSDPYWYDEANHDYMLKAFSPCIDAGDPTIFDPDGSVVDMGAHPYDPFYTP